MSRCSIVLLILALALAPVHALAAPPVDDGQYTIEVSLWGGTGRADISSPTTITVTNGEMFATIVWSSPYYENMLVGGVYFDPIQAQGNSTFEIPVVLDAQMEVSAQTIAMSQPHKITYTLYFDSLTMKPSDQDRTVGDAALIAAAASVLLMAFIVVAAGRKRHGPWRKRGVT